MIIVAAGYEGGLVGLEHPLPLNSSSYKQKNSSNNQGITPVFRFLCTQVFLF